MELRFFQNPVWESVWAEGSCVSVFDVCRGKQHDYYMLRYNMRFRRGRMSIKIGEEEISGGLAQLADQENGLLSEKERLLDIMEQLEDRLTSEIKRKKSLISSLRTEVYQLQKRCEELADALEIPVIK